LDNKANKILNSNNIKTISFDELFHVGTLDRSKKRDYNLEGNTGLSITTEPEAWKRINRGQTNGDLWSLEKSDNAFINVHELSKVQLNLIYKWGVGKGYIEPTVKFEFSYYDDEMKQELSFQFDTLKEANIEADGENEVRKISGYSANETFSKRVGEANKANISLVVALYCEDETDFDGVYWNDDLDVPRYSAPRGIIFDSKLESWTVTNDNIDRELQKKDLLSVVGWLSADSPEDLVIEQPSQVPIDIFSKQINEMESTYDEFTEDKDRTEAIYDKIKNGEKPQPVYVEKDDVDLFVMEGRHRMVAFKWLGMSEVPLCYVSKTPIEISIKRKNIIKP
jgi:hypothetical protein